MNRRAPRTRAWTGGPVETLSAGYGEFYTVDLFARNSNTRIQVEVDQSHGKRAALKLARRVERALNASKEVADATP